MTDEEKIEKIRSHISNDFSNTAWLRATGYSPLDVDHCGSELWALWYDPHKLSVTMASHKNLDLASWQLLANKLEYAFNKSVERVNRNYQ